jgi:hypothetical protein
LQYIFVSWFNGYNQALATLIIFWVSTSADEFNQNQTTTLQGREWGYKQTFFSTMMKQNWIT